jgi:hypothetical protein
LVEGIPFPSQYSSAGWDPIRDGDSLGLIVLLIALRVLRDLEPVLVGWVSVDVIGQVGEAVSNVSSSEEPLNLDLITGIDCHLRCS